MAGTSEAAIGVAHVQAGQPVSVGDVMLCLSAPGSATIRSVALHQPTGDIEVQAFATRPNPFARGLDAIGDPQPTIAGLWHDLDPAAPAAVSVSRYLPNTDTQPHLPHRRMARLDT